MSTQTRPPAPPAYSARNELTLVCDIPIDAIHPSPLNPRKAFDAQALQELADSITADGLLEPIVVRGRSGALLSSAGLPDSYEIIAGERRWRACKLAGLEIIAARIMEGVDDKMALRLALLENLQRQDLDPIEEAEGYRTLARELGLKQTQIAEAVKRSQPAVAKSMSLLDLPDDVVAAIRDGRLSVAHGVALSKFKRFPQTCSAIAAAAVETGCTSHQLERSIPRPFDLERAGVLKMLASYSAPFDVAATCEHCPFGAYRPLADGYKVCLNPDHYHELVAAAKASKEQEVQAQITAAKASGAAVLGAIADLGPEIRRVYDAPTGCSAACACRAQATGYSSELETICTDPKRYDKLRQAEAKRKKQEAAESYYADVRELERRLDAMPLGRRCDEGQSLEACDRRAFALVVHMALTRLQAEDVKASLVARKVPVKQAHLSNYHFDARGADELARLPVREQLALAVDALLRADLRQRREWDGHTTKRFSWFMGAGNDDAAAEGAAESGETVRCAACEAEVARRDVRELGHGPLCPECASDVDPGDFAGRLGLPPTVGCLDCGAEVLVTAAIGEPRGPLCPACAAVESDAGARCATCGKPMTAADLAAAVEADEVLLCAQCHQGTPAEARP